MTSTTAIVNIGQLVTLAGPARPRVRGELGDLAVIEDGALLVQDRRVAAAGPYERIKSKIPVGAKIIDAERRCVTPGFVDAHTHLVFAGNRAAEFEQRIAGATYQEIAAAGGGILRTVALTRAASEDELLVAARRHRDWMLRGGTTTLEAKSGYGLDRDTELKMLRVIRRLNEEGPVRSCSNAAGSAHGTAGVQGSSGRLCAIHCGRTDPGSCGYATGALLRRLLRRSRIHGGGDSRRC